MAKPKATNGEGLAAVLRRATPSIPLTIRLTEKPSDKDRQVIVIPMGFANGWSALEYVWTDPSGVRSRAQVCSPRAPSMQHYMQGPSLRVKGAHRHPGEEWHVFSGGTYMLTQNAVIENAVSLLTTGDPADDHAFSPASRLGTIPSDPFKDHPFVSPQSNQRGVKRRKATPDFVPLRWAKEYAAPAPVLSYEEILMKIMFSNQGDRVTFISLDGTRVIVRGAIGFDNAGRFGAEFVAQSGLVHPVVPTEVLLPNINFAPDSGLPARWRRGYRYEWTAGQMVSIVEALLAPCTPLPWRASLGPGELIRDK